MRDLNKFVYRMGSACQCNSVTCGVNCSDESSNRIISDIIVSKFVRCLACAIKKEILHGYNQQESAGKLNNKKSIDRAVMLKEVKSTTSSGSKRIITDQFSAKGNKGSSSEKSHSLKSKTGKDPEKATRKTINQDLVTKKIAKKSKQKEAKLNNPLEYSSTIHCKKVRDNKVVATSQECIDTENINRLSETKQDHYDDMCVVCQRHSLYYTLKGCMLRKNKNYESDCPKNMERENCPDEIESNFQLLNSGGCYYYEENECCCESCCRVCRIYEYYYTNQESDDRKVSGYDSTIENNL
ncbi:hypothetical protein BEWA_009610 [Theileria equi strain WA]|uniref:Uncharacterized protein n=1 Tax=Theileria equi strain WA TaxID=1537102 RepID=L0B107_THEEQ|nr:hypothetical protein BEWA_009610 [Theileria equi strain WA]AFZ81547.1 hypothetical protein BEWA_009610 [Theileria equi strain WA]|eukprot:XP_004831213.1 hypothetical protein BEWA_009610 [Theileria equi strain WA]